jgi:hypothetical protein
MRVGTAVFSDFNFDDIPDFEPLELSLVVLRSNPFDESTLTKILNMEVDDLFEHFQWDELLCLLEISLTCDDRSTSNIAIAVHLRFLDTFSNHCQVKNPLFNVLRLLFSIIVKEEIPPDFMQIIDYTVIQSIRDDDRLMSRLQLLLQVIKFLPQYIQALPEKDVERVLLTMFMILNSGCILDADNSSIGKPFLMRDILFSIFPCAHKLMDILMKWPCFTVLQHADHSGLLSGLQYAIYNSYFSPSDIFKQSDQYMLWLFSCDMFLRLLLPWAKNGRIPVSLLSNLVRGSADKSARSISFEGGLPIPEYIDKTAKFRVNIKFFAVTNVDQNTMPEARHVIAALFTNIREKLSNFIEIRETHPLRATIIQHLLRISVHILETPQYISLLDTILPLSAQLESSNQGLRRVVLLEEFNYACATCHDDNWVRKNIISSASTRWLTCIYSCLQSVSREQLSIFLCPWATWMAVASTGVQDVYSKDITHTILNFCIRSLADTFDALYRDIIPKALEFIAQLVKLPHLLPPSLVGTLFDIVYSQLDIYPESVSTLCRLQSHSNQLLFLEKHLSHAPIEMEVLHGLAMGLALLGYLEVAVSIGFKCPLRSQEESLLQLREFAYAEDVSVEELLLHTYGGCATMNVLMQPLLNDLCSDTLYASHPLSQPFSDALSSVCSVSQELYHSHLDPNFSCSKLVKQFRSYETGAKPSPQARLFSVFDPLLPRQDTFRMIDKHHPFSEVSIYECLCYLLDKSKLI